MRVDFRMRNENKPTLRAIAQEIQNLGGLTVNWRNTRMERPAPEDRYIVGLGNYYEQKYYMGSEPSIARIAECVNSYVGSIGLDRDLQGSGLWLGAWLDLGVLYLDVCRTYSDPYDANRAAKRNGEPAYYDAETDEAIEVDITRI